MKEAIGDFLRANSKAIAALIAGEVAALVAKYVAGVDVSIFATQVASILSAAIVWLAPKNEEKTNG